jgi:hypothetical protein
MAAKQHDKPDALPLKTEMDTFFILPRSTTSQSDAALSFWEISPVTAASEQQEQQPAEQQYQAQEQPAEQYQVQRNLNDDNNSNNINNSNNSNNSNNNTNKRSKPRRTGVLPQELPLIGC